jgi:trigger factor
MTDETPANEPAAEGATIAEDAEHAEEAPEITEAADDEGAAEADGEKKPEKLNQTVELKDIGPCKKHIKVTVDRGDIDKLLNEKFSELVKDSVVPGFRPGKAPRRVVTRRFHKDVTDQVRGQVLMASLEQLAEDHDVAPLTAPNIDPKKIEIPKEGPFIYEFDVEVRPQFDLPDYKGMKLQRPVKKFTDEDVAREEHRLLSRYGQLVPKEGGSAAIGDYLVVDMTTRFADVVIGGAKELSLRVDDRLAFRDGVADGFADKTIGAKAGETRVVDIAMSDSVALEQLRGKTLQATLEIKDVKQMRLPELTHEFLHNFGVHSPEQFREQIRVLLERRLDYEQRQSAREQVLSQISAASSWELPQDLLYRQARTTLARRVMEMQEAGISEDEIRARERLLQRDVLRSTEEALKEHFVLQKIAEVEKLDIDEDDINDEIERLAEINNEPPRRVRARLEKDDLLETMAAQLIERKALDLVLSTAQYTDVEVGKTAEGRVTNVEAQAVPGEMKDPTAVPPSSEETKESADQPKS